MLTNWFVSRPRRPLSFVSLGDSEQIRDILARDGLAILPTETGYMVAANAFSQVATERVRVLKGRISGHTISCGLLIVDDG